MRYKYLILGLFILVLLGAGTLFLVQNRMKNISNPTTPIDAPLPNIDFSKQTFVINGISLQKPVDGQFFTSDEGTHSAHINTKANSELDDRSAAILVDPADKGTDISYYLIGGMADLENILYSEPILLGKNITIRDLIVKHSEGNGYGTVTVSYSGQNDKKENLNITRTYEFQNDGNLKEAVDEKK